MRFFVRKFFEEDLRMTYIYYYAELFSNHKKEFNMISRRFSDGIPILGIGIFGYVHEFVISIKPEILPTLLFSLLIVKGITILFAKKEK